MMNQFLMLSMLGKIFRGQHGEIFVLSSPENRFDISCKLSPKDKLCFLDIVAQMQANILNFHAVMKNIMQV